MLIALIDDGIDVSVIDSDLLLKHDLTVEEGGKIRERRMDEPILTDHGTTCASIILKYAPQAQFASLRIFHEETLEANCNMLVSALEWCLHNDIPIVHMSVGSSHLSDYSEIRRVVSKMLQKHQMIISAHSNKDSYSIPACLAGVFGVMADEKMVEDEYSFGQDSNYPLGLELKASSRHELSWYSGYTFTTQITNSYAAPTITAIICNMLQEAENFFMSIPHVLRELRRKVGEGDICSHFPKPDFMAEALLFNPYGYPILKHRLFFDILEEDKVASCSSGHDLLILLPESVHCANETLCFLQENEGNYRNILYGGRLSESSDSNLGYLVHRDDFIWTEDFLPYSYFENREETTGKTEDSNKLCPVINIYGRDLQSLELLCQLRDMFIDDEYQYMGVSNHRFSYLYGIEHIPNVEKKGIALDYINNMFRPDVILCFWQQENPEIDSESDEYHVIVGTAEEREKWGYSTGTLARNISVYFTDISRGLYEKILEYFS